MATTMQKQKILLLEPDHRERTALCRDLEDWGYSVLTAREGTEALEMIKSTTIGLVISDFDIPGQTNGIDFINTVKSDNDDIRIFFTAKQASVENAVDAMKAGAIDFVLKPVDHSHIRYIVSRAFDGNGLLDEECRQRNYQSVNIVTQDDAMTNLLNMARQVAASTASVLIQGESGTGKELFARYIHENSPRRNGPFIAVNCAALPDSLLESELFGHEKGAFTGAVSKKPGKFELADKGTILLDEVTEMMFHLQSKLLRIIQEKEVDRVGGRRPVKIDVRIISTSNRDIQETIKKGEFREDLYHRLNTIPIRIPPLRERPSDIKLLVRHLIDKYNEIDGRHVKSLTQSALNVLENLQFTGNVRELENIIQRAILLSDGETITEEDFILENHHKMDASCDDAGEEIPFNFYNAPIREIEKKMIFHTLDRTKGNRTHAAKILGISVRTLRNKLNEYRDAMESV